MTVVMGEFAAWYAELGWPVLPVYTVDEFGECSCGRCGCENAGKDPCVPHGLTEATCDPDTIRAWWDRWPEANIGIACAESGLVALDIDPRHGGDETLVELEAQLGPLPDTVTANTGGGGRHLLFEHPGQDRLRGSLGPGVDVRANAYIVVEPSVYKSGNRYEWSQDRAPGGAPGDLDVLPRAVEEVLAEVLEEVTYALRVGRRAVESRAGRDEPLVRDEPRESVVEEEHATDGQSEEVHVGVQFVLGAGVVSLLGSVGAA